MIGAEDLIDKTNYRNLDPWNLIKRSCEAQCIKIRRPKSGCKRCHGRGWIGRKAETGEPIPCRCIFVKEDFATKREEGEAPFRPKNREQRRHGK